MTQLPSMNMNTLPSGGVNSDPVPAALHACRIIRIADVGTIPNKFRPQDQPKPRLRVGFEVTDHQIKWNKDGQDVMGNSLAYKTITVSAGERSVLTALFRAADPTGQLTGGEVWNLIGLPVLVMFSPNRDGIGTFIDSFSPLMPGMQIPNPTVETWAFSVAAPDPEVWKSLNGTIKDLVRSNIQGGAQLFEQMEAATGSPQAPVQATYGQQPAPQQFAPPQQAAPQQAPVAPAQPAYAAPAQAPAQPQPVYQAPVAPQPAQVAQPPAQVAPQQVAAPAMVAPAPQQVAAPVAGAPAQQLPAPTSAGAVPQQQPGVMDFNDDIAF